MRRAGSVSFAMICSRTPVRCPTPGVRSIRVARAPGLFYRVAFPSIWQRSYGSEDTIGRVSRRRGARRLFQNGIHAMTAATVMTGDAMTSLR